MELDSESSAQHGRITGAAPDFDGDPVKEKRRIMKNIILISVAFLMNFNAFQGLARLQSTLNLQDGIGKGYQEKLFP